MSLRLLLLALILVAASQPGMAAEPPRIGLVLGGGGARGAAHIGVLEVLAEQRIPIACVAGTSMGGLVAGAWAAGLAPARMQEALAAVDWSDMFLDNPDYGEMSHRNRAISRRYLPGSESGVGADGVRYQGGMVSGQKIKLFFNRLVGNSRIERLYLPLSIVATDIGSGEAVVFRDGDLSTAMRASMSVPGLLAPVEHGGRKLVDGGLVDNLPVAEIRERCNADVVIAVDVGTPLLKAEEVGSLISVSTQMIGILTRQNVARSLAMLRDGDILIQPALDGIGAGDFRRHVEAAERGRQAALAVVDQLAALAITPGEYAAWWQGVEAQAVPPVPIDDIQVAGLRRVNPRSLDRFLDIAPGDVPSASRIDRNLQRIYGDGDYESVDYAVTGSEGRNILRIMPVEKPWGPDYLRFGINLAADDGDGASFGIRAAYHRTWLNSLGGEMLYHAELGSHNRLGLNFYQPLDPAQRYFTELLVGVEQERLSVFENDRRIARYKVNESRVGAWLGYNAHVYGAVRLGWLQRRHNYQLDTGTLALPTGDVHFGGWQATLDFDRSDRMYFPTKGWAARLNYFHAASRDYARLDAELRGAFKLADTIFNARLAYTGSPRGELPAYDAGRLGGFLNMTAYSHGQLLGDDIHYAGLRTERIIGRLPLGLRGDMRFGVALEAARLGRRFSETGRDGWLDSLAVYLGGETPLGPAYLGVGRSRQGASNLFLFIGTP
jgi:NTE family protein